MPAGNELGSYKGKSTSIRTLEICGGEWGIEEGTYTAQASAQLSSTVSGTVTFSGSNERRRHTTEGPHNGY